MYELNEVLRIFVDDWDLEEDLFDKKVLQTELWNITLDREMIIFVNFSSPSNITTDIAQPDNLNIDILQP